MIEIEPEDMMFSVGIHGRETRVVIDGARMLCEAELLGIKDDVSVEAFAAFIRGLATVVPPEDGVSDGEIAAVGWRVVNRMNDLGNARGPRPTLPRPTESSSSTAA